MGDRDLAISIMRFMAFLAYLYIGGLIFMGGDRIKRKWSFPGWMLWFTAPGWVWATYFLVTH